MRAQDLKNSILQMAVQGKLVEQDPSEEPAFVLLERIREKRAELVKQKRVKAPKGGESVIYCGADGSWYERRGKGEPTCIDDEIPFDIPDGWEWVRLETVMSLSSGLGYKKENLAVSSDQMVRVLRGGNIGLNDVVELKGNDVFIASEFVDESLYLKPGQIITPAVTSLENVGKAALVRAELPSTVCGGFVFFLTPYLSDLVISEFLHYWMIAPSHRRFCKDNVKKSGQAFYNLSKVALNGAFVAIPPLAEQRRIVGRIDELMPLVEEYGELEDAREALDAALPDRLRKSVLQMAVEGKLVPQDPSDEPASVLLERIREERAELVKQKKVKAPKGGESVIYRDGGSWYERRGKSDSVCINDEIPFDIPESWEWVRLGDLGDWKAGATPAKGRTDYYKNGTIPWLLTGDLNDGLVTVVPNLITEKALAECSVRLNPAGSILVAMYGATIGKIGVLGIPATTNQACCACILHDDIVREWLVAWLKYQKPHFIKLGEGGAQPNISREKIVSRLVPIPPISEQRRIVERIDGIINLIGDWD